MKLWKIISIILAIVLTIGIFALVKLFVIGFAIKNSRVCIYNAEVTSNKINISGTYLVAPATSYARHVIYVKENSIYIKFYEALGSIIHPSRNFWIELKGNYYETENIYISDGNEDELIWSKEIGQTKKPWYQRKKEQ